MPALASLLHEFCAAVDQPIVFVDLNLQVLQTNQAFRDRLHVKADEVEQTSLFSLPDGSWNGPDLRQMLCEQERRPYGVLASSEIAWTLGQSAEETVCVSVYFVSEFENDEPTQILIAIRRQTGAREDSTKLAEIGKLLSQATAIPAPGLYFRQILELCLFAVCEMTGWQIGHFWLSPEEKNKRLVPSDVWRCPANSETSHLRQATRTAGVSSEPGFPEQVVQARQLIWLDELAHFDDPHRQEVLQSLGIRTAIGVPVHVGGRVRAVLELFDTKSVPRSTEIVRFCTQICQLAGRVIERQESTELLREARVASTRSQLARSQFLANMSHELKTPMTAILGMLDLSLQEKLPSTVRENLWTAHNSAQELLTLLNTILDHASLASETLTLIEQPFRLYELLQQTMTPYVERTTRKGLRWTLEISPDVPDRFVGDAVRLKQVIDHLLDNAVKFTERGAIDIQVTLDQQNSDEETKLSITVGDTGPGFSTEEVHRLFEGFTQADASFARRHRGAGLGLAICTALINRLGGEFAIESQLGIGTRSQFTIPLKRQEYHSESCGDGASICEYSCQDEESATPDFRPLTILLAEDTPANQKLIDSILVKRGHRVMLASNGQEALEHFSKHDFDLVIMDLQMPKLDGYQATEAIRRREADTQRHMPIIALTAHSGASDRKACLEAGMDAYLSKPINVAELIRVTESLANRTPFTSAERMMAAAADEDVFLLDRDSILKRLGGDEELFSSFIEVFLEDAPQLIEQLCSGIAEHDSRLVQRSAHSLRGLAANFNAEAVIDLAIRLENAGKGGDFSEANSLLPQLHNALDHLREALAAYQ